VGIAVRENYDVPGGQLFPSSISSIRELGIGTPLG
jgi:hypothetical protein